MENMFTIKQDKTNVTVTVSIDGKEWKEAEQKVYETTKGKFNVIGFRKGHAPKKVIEKQYGENVFFDDTLDYFLRTTMNEVLAKDPNLEPLSYPKTAIQSLNPDGGVKFTLEFEVMPDFKLCKYTGLNFTKRSTKVTDEDIEHELEHLRQDSAKFNEVERASKLGDSVVIDFVGSVDGKEFEGGRAEDYPLTLGSHSFIDNFEDQLVGKKKGETVKVEVTFPSEYPADNLAGKKADFFVTIKNVREKVLPKIDDKFISDATEFETLDEYKNHVSKHIQYMKEQEADNLIKSDILEYIISNTEMYVPQSLIDYEVERDIHEIQEACKQYNMSLENYLSAVGTSMEQIKEESAKRAVRGIKGRYIIRKIIEENKITASDEEIEEKLKNLPPMRHSHAHEGADEDRIYAENSVVLDKVYKLLIDKNNIKEEDEKKTTEKGSTSAKTTKSAEKKSTAKSGTKTTSVKSVEKKSTSSSNKSGEKKTTVKSTAKKTTKK